MRTDYKTRNLKDKVRSVAKGFALFVKLYILFISYIIWAIGEFLFMIGTPFFTDYYIFLLLGVAGFFAILVISLLLIIYLTKPGYLPPVRNNQPEESKYP